MSLGTAGSSLTRRHRSSSLETILDDSAPLTRQQIFLSNDSLASRFSSNCRTIRSRSHSTSASTKTPAPSGIAPHGLTRLSGDSAAAPSAPRRVHALRPKSVGSCLDIVVETSEESFKESKWRGRAASCSNVNASEDRNRSRAAARPPSSCARSPHATSESSGHPPASGASSLWTLSAPAVVRRCLSSLDVSKLPRPASLFKPSVCAPTARMQPPEPKSQHSKTFSLSACLSADV